MQANQLQTGHRKRRFIKTSFGKLEGFITKFNNDWTMQSAGTLAYNLMVAVVPIAIAIIAVFGLTIGALNPDAQKQLIDGIKNAFPSSSFSTGILQVVFTSLHRNAGFLGILAIFTAIFGGSRLFLTLEGCFAIIYRTYSRKVIAQNVMAILMMIIFIILVPLMVFTSSVPALLLSLLQNSAVNQLPFVAQLTHNGLFLGAVSIVSGVIISWILFETIFVFVPNQKISFKNSWRGALLSAVLLEAFLALFPLYITHFMGSYIGTAGFAIILLVFFYYFAVILLLGSEVNAYFAERIIPLPNNLAAVIHDSTKKYDDSHKPGAATENSERKAALHTPESEAGQQNGSAQTGEAPTRAESLSDARSLS